MIRHTLRLWVFAGILLCPLGTAASGGTSVTISPRLSGLTWARGTVVSAQGPVEVSWKRTGNTITLAYSVPSGVKAVFSRNPSLEGLKVIVNGQPVH
ncbi:MAG TPA: alpha-L-rhamnosidase C-terminal domain-containing protein [Verrucomicrobiota bacterium]|nr:alpha-L-rhamnosidase C-terminal domain-containing protein [Verrucomicrobiota bacterium]HNU52975.1 alpha-L-rhamnosidase C-terminal domain-containing protein [Verrucomicrobiota bacterium]